MLPRLSLLVLLLAACNRPRAGGVWDFEEDAAGQAPRGFSFALTGEGRPGRWAVQRVDDGGARRAVLTQLDHEPTKKRQLVALAPSLPLGDVSAQVRCKLVTGGVDRGCGVVVRYQDPGNYYLARIDSLDGDLRMYVVRDGKRGAFATYTGRITDGEWHQIRVDVVGDRFVVWYDGRPVIDAYEKTLRAPGGVGVWTKSDAIVWFDELRASPAAK